MPTGQFSVLPSDANVQEGRSHLPVDFAATTIGPSGGKGTVTVAAGSTGVRYVATHASFSLTTASVIGATTVQIAVIDGASGGTTFLWLSQIVVAGSGGINIDSPSMQVVGSAATALTAEFSAGIANTWQGVTLHYHRIGENTV